ncbi:WD repeat-containing protein 43 [Durio zibethinus]|uniref:WD repeat-containing protein 43 n=1 Tax=Durio zibethinus TaxID=66656 RepID=A0A6P5X850_DURZI|nr:WD repeat-containing protein 43 [Durio zibethinus]
MDSVDILLMQALHGGDRALLLDCLYTQDQKVFANSVSQLNTSNVLKLLQSLVSIMQSRGAIMACALPWIKSLLLQHASGIMPHESSLLALNSLYQLIESRVSTFESALQISSCLDFLYAGICVMFKSVAGRRFLSFDRAIYSNHRCIKSHVQLGLLITCQVPVNAWIEVASYKNRGHLLPINFFIIT